MFFITFVQTNHLPKNISFQFINNLFEERMIKWGRLEFKKDRNLEEIIRMIDALFKQHNKILICCQVS
jgi:protein-tyrosine phosphatase